MPAKAAFTLVELLVSMSIFSILLVLLASAGDQSRRIMSRANQKISSFQSARVAFEAMTRKVKQATLNTYWGYDNPSNPTQYIRRSELQFVCGQANTLLTSTSGQMFGPTQAVFFQAPTGYSTDPADRPLNQLLNTCGFFIQFGSDADNKPAFVKSPERWRYRLMELTEPTRDLSVHEKWGTRDWFQTPIATGTDALVMADNIIAVIIRPVKTGTTGLPTDITSDYSYDTSIGTSATSLTANQLPPILSVTLVAIDEGSAQRFENGSTPPVFVRADKNWFTDTSKYADDLKELEASLVSQHINYRVFSTEIALPASKWSE